MTLLADWKRFVAGELTFDKSHFLNLFADIQDHDFVHVFQTYQNGAEAAARALDARNSANHRRPLSDTDILDLARRVVRQDGQLLEEIGEYDLLPVAEPRLEDRDKLDLIAEADRNVDIQAALGDAFSEHVDYSDPVLVALEEAIYGIASSYDVARFVMEPLIGGPLPTDARYLLWKHGSAIAYHDDKVFVSRPV